jgi:hypothetical protein
MLSSLLAIVTLAQSPSPDLVVSTSQFAAHYATLRHGVVRPSEVDERYRPGVNILKQIPERLTVKVAEVSKQVPSFSVMDPLVFRCTNLVELRAFTSQKPPAASYTNAQGQPANYLSLVLQAMTQTEAAHRAVWPGQYGTLKVQVAAWKPYEKKSEEAFAWLTKALGYEEPPARVEVVLLPVLGGRAGIHSAWGSNLRVMVVADQYVDADLAEVILRETAVGLNAINPSPFLRELREALLAGGITPQVADRVQLSSLWVLSGHAIRSIAEPGHIDVGENSGYYETSNKPYVDAVKQALQYLPDNRTKAVTEIVSQVKSYEPSR